MLAPLKEERGVSSIVGLVLIMGLVTIAMTVYLREEVPVDWKEEEYKTMTWVKGSFMELRSRIRGLENGQVSTTKIQTGTPSPTALLSTSSSAIVNVVGARSVDDAEEVYYYDTTFGSRYLHTYVSEANSDQNYQSSGYDNDHLYVSTTEGQRMWTYLKFDLSDTYLYDSSNYEFRDDIEIHDVRLLLYAQDVDLVEDPSEVMEIQVPLNVELWAVENSAWDEGITWDTRPQVDPDRDRKLDNTDVDGEGGWVGWRFQEGQLTRYLKEKWEKLSGWGKWYQTKWQEDTATCDVGKFSSGYWKFDDYQDIEFYEPDEGIWHDTPGENRGYTIRGTSANAYIQSSVFDAGDNNACWNYISWSASDVVNTTVWVRFDNDACFTSPTDWENVIDGENNYAYIENYGRCAQYRISLDSNDYFYDITLEYTYHLSFVLREPEAWGPSSLQNRVAFISDENRWARVADFTPRLRITYSRAGRPGYAGEGMIDLGYIKYRANNQYFTDQAYIYEGGMLISQRCGTWGSGYDTLLERPEELVEITPVGRNQVQIDITRYQIEPSSIGGESVGGTGYTSIRVQREEEEWLVKSSATPNREEVKITINTDHPDPWRDYLEYLAAKANYVISGYEDWDTYGDYANYDYETISLTIYGRDPDLEDIYYSERVVWLDTSIGYFQGGRS